MKPERMCMVCRERRPKSELLRIVRVKGLSPEIDETQKAQGRGMYICKTKECISQARRRRIIERAFGNGADEVYESLEQEAEK